VKKPTDNYLVSLNAIIRCLLDEGPYGIPAYERQRLEERITQPDSPSSPSIYTKVERWNREATCSLEIELKPVEFQGFADDDGDHWVEYRVEADVNWPLHGTTGLVQAQARVALYTEVIAFATNLMAAWHRTLIYRLMQTKAEYEETQVQLARGHAEAQAQVLVQNHSKGLRANEDREVSGSEVPAGDYRVNINTRTYMVRSDGSGLSNIHRIN
jgi:hypothetical protein